MAIGYALFGILVAVAAGIGTAALGSSPFAMIFAYAGCGASVLFAAVLSTMLFDRDEQYHEDPMLVPGK
ncbi:MAG: hypothetical protein ACR2O1_02305 [Boseongicola sp.]